MKKLLIATAVFATCAAPQAFAQTAQSKNFEGFSAGINANYAKTRASARFGNEYGSTDDTSTNGSVQGAYGFALNDKFVMGVGATAGFGDLDAGSINGVSLKAKDMYSIYVEPGYRVTDKTLVYGKVSYQRMKGELSGSGISASDTYDGYGIGLGVRSMVSNKFYVQAELSELDYGSESVRGIEVEPKQTMATVGVGYKF
ncbi:porin family protein [Actimicrobium sp. CCI2.3]|uniref:porin family protein n=1 Tax=Actimicrobium sp. CCI2.3 TaxID=3048616 RepID=UPI002AB5B16B|nr:porin family protein [Actimicrobium sp. CCI2.3]MDY7574375.1 porin family protein [Actimicrobium sp. CCI2.3]MEB0024130.1 porin family protein [Actimicrobium sp. CCI2.3]